MSVKSSYQGTETLHGELRHKVGFKRFCDVCGEEIPLKMQPNTGNPASRIAPPYTFELGKELELAVFYLEKGEHKDCCHDCTIQYMRRALGL